MAAMARMIEKRLNVRTPGEELWCRRRAAGLSCEAMARVFGIGRTSLHLAEKDEGHAATLLSLCDLPRPSTEEKFALARRREGWTLAKTARKMKVSHVTLMRMEREVDFCLLSFWRGRGFTFV